MYTQSINKELKLEDLSFNEICLVTVKDLLCQIYFNLSGTDGKEELVENEIQ